MLEESLTSREMRRVLYHALLILLGALLFIRFEAVSRQYPYYAFWDMDHVATIDTLLVNSGRLPDHITHTGLGLYLVTSLSTRLARFGDVVSIADLTDLAGALNPLAGVAELAGFLRAHSPYLALIITLALWATVTLAVRPPPGLSLLILAAAGTQTSFLFQSGMIRTELYSVLFWAVALPVLAATARCERIGARAAGLLGAGFLLGAAFITKLQSVFLVAAAPPLMLLVAARGDDERRDEFSRWRTLIVCGAAVANLLVFALLVEAARRIEIPPGFHTNTRLYEMTTLARLTRMGLVLLAASSAWYAVTGPGRSTGGRITAALTILFSGFLLSFGLHFIIGGDGAQSLRYMLYDVKLLFVRTFYYEVLSPFPAVPHALISFAPATFAVGAATLIMLTVGRLARVIRLTTRDALIGGGLCLLLLASLNLGVRPQLKDWIWAETSVNLLSFFGLSLAVSRAESFRRTISSLAGLLLVALTIANLAHGVDMPRRIDANYNLYGWSEARWPVSSFAGNQTLYARLMREAYGDSPPAAAFHAARNERGIRRTVEFVCPNLDVTHRAIGVLAPGFSVSLADRSWRLSTVPEELDGGTIVDIASLPPTARFLEPDSVRAPSERLDKLRISDELGRIAVLTRADLRILLFVDEEEAAAMARDLIRPTGIRVTLRRGGRTPGGEARVMRALEIAGYSEIDVPESGAFLAIMRLADLPH